MFDLATAKTRLKITGTAQDVELQGALDVALALAETYCDRRFIYSSDTESFTHFEGGTIGLRRYPLDAITSVQDAIGKPVGKYHIDAESGLIYLDAFLVRHKTTVTYTGGYKTLPADLELALWQLFDATWNASQNAGAASVAGGGAVQSIQSEGQRISYFDPSKGSGGSGAFGVMAGDSIPFSVTSILNLYKRISI